MKKKNHPMAQNNVSASGEAQPHYPESLPGSKGVSMPIFMSIGPKQWALEGYIYIRFDGTYNLQ